jgi:hypothetical protein
MTVPVLDRISSCAAFNLLVTNYKMVGLVSAGRVQDRLNQSRLCILHPYETPRRWYAAQSASQAQIFLRH